MNPDLPPLLERLVDLADKLIKAHNLGPWCYDRADTVALDQLEGALTVLIEEPRADKDFDETALLLVQALRFLNERAGPLGDSVQGTRWRLLSTSMLAIVRTDYARAQGFAGVPDAPDYVPMRHQAERRR